MKLFVSFFRFAIRTGTLTIIDAAGQRYMFGGRKSGPAASIRLHDASLHWRLVTNPSRGLGEGYMDGTLTLEDGTSLIDLLTLLMINDTDMKRHGISGALNAIIRAVGRIGRINPIGRARRNVKHHYDLKDELFALFLDKKRQYSCAFFTDRNDSLDQAQANKMNLITRKLLLRPGLRVLDIGSGWGGLALHLAQTADVDVTGITLSQEQFAYSNAWAKRAAQDGHCRFALRDYRSEKGTYDRIVSVGMLEHVGLRHYRTFFRKIARALADDGVALVHTVGAVDRPGPVASWIDRYIFPGAYVPTLSELTPAAERAELIITDVEILRLHYAETLKLWRQRFMANRDKALALYDERFCRMWEFYLAACEVGFRIGDLVVFQLQLSKRVDAVPLTRNYMTPPQLVTADQHRLAS